MTESIKSNGKVSYAREFLMTPFTFSVLPHERKQFCTIILGSPTSSALPKLLQFVINAHLNECIVYPAYKDTPSFNLSSEFSSKHSMEKIPTEELASIKEGLQNKLVITDLTQGNEFKSLHPAIYWCKKEVPDWLYDYHIQRALFPNLLLNTFGNWENNYSHTIWLASSLEDVPKVLLNSAHMTFVLENAQTYMKKKLGVENSSISSDVILAISSTLRSDPQIMTMSRKRFL